MCPPKPEPGEGHNRLDLRVLRTSRFIYEEAFDVLYKSNTFAFPEAIAVKRFLMTRTLQQTQALRSMHLDMVLWQDKTWPAVLTKHILPSCSGLCRLSLVIDLGLIQIFRKGDETSKIQERIHKLCPGLLSLSNLPLRDVNVVVKGRSVWIQQGGLQNIEQVIHNSLLKRAYIH